MELDTYSEVCKANSGAIRFQVKSISGHAQLHLSGINPPHKDLFHITLSGHSRIGNLQSGGTDDVTAETTFINLTDQFQEFWLTWYNDNICLGFGDNPEPFLSCKYQSDEKEMIGYIKFARQFGSHHLLEWIYESSPIISKALEPKQLRSGELRWVTLMDHRLPPDALIAGFENEPLYVARALHRDAMCPGKYMHSKRRAFVPWGYREHEKNEFQILCGYNATWVETSGDKIPQNAFIGGVSEVRDEPLYVGRAVHDGHLINGKVHVIYASAPSRPGKYPPYPPYDATPAPPSVADTIVAGRGLRATHKAVTRPQAHPLPKPARPKAPKVTDVKMSRRAMRAHARCLRRHGAVLTDRLERLAKPRRRHIIYLWREHADLLPPETIERFRCMLNADEPFKPDQAYEYFINCRKTKKKANAAHCSLMKKDMHAVVTDKRFVWARNATVAFARGIQQRLSRPGRYTLADGMLRLSNVILAEICGYMKMRTPSRRCTNTKAKFMMEMSDKIAVWIDEILSESDDRMLMMDYDEDDEVKRSLEDEKRPPSEVPSAASTARASTADGTTTTPGRTPSVTSGDLTPATTPGDETPPPPGGETPPPPGDTTAPPHDTK